MKKFKFNNEIVAKGRKKCDESIELLDAREMVQVLIDIGEVSDANLGEIVIQMLSILRDFNRDKDIIGYEKDSDGFMIDISFFTIDNITSNEAFKIRRVFMDQAQILMDKATELMSSENKHEKMYDFMINFAKGNE